MTFLLKDGKAQQTKLEIGRNNGTSAEVRGGIKQGDIVILHPPDKLVDGSEARSRSGSH